MNNRVSRYSDNDLAEFKSLIERKLEKAKEQRAYLEEQIESTNDSINSMGDWKDDTTNNTDLEMMQTMAHRQRKHIRDLENALLRIQNKTYGVCVLSGHLIDKRRLMAVPTTTKSLDAKLSEQSQEKKNSRPVSTPRNNGKPQIITKIIRPMKQAAPLVEEGNFEEDFDLDSFDGAEEVDNAIDLD